MLFWNIAEVTNLELATIAKTLLAIPACIPEISIPEHNLNHLNNEQLDKAIALYIIL